MPAKQNCKGDRIRDHLHHLVCESCSTDSAPEDVAKSGSNEEDNVAGVGPVPNSRREISQKHNFALETSSGEWTVLEAHRDVVLEPVMRLHIPILSRCKCSCGSLYFPDINLSNCIEILDFFLFFTDSVLITLTTSDKIALAKDETCKQGGRLHMHC